MVLQVAGAQEQPASPALPLAPDTVGADPNKKLRGYRPRVNPALVPPAATQLAPGLENLPAPASLALPVKPGQVVIQQLRPLGLQEVENLAEVSNPNLKAIASQVDQAQSNLRAQIALWYPNLNLQASSLPTFTTGVARSNATNGATS
jgi:OMF family outer membrane factor